MDRSVSPEGGHKALLAAAENVTGLVFIDDGAADAFVKEESSSPPGADDDRPFRMPLKFKAADPPQRLISGTPAGKAGSAQQQGSRPGRHGKGGASKASHKAPPAPGQPIIPRRVEDWDPWKGVLYELYITQNRILRDIIGIMETKHNLRAT
jgi:hypothetical protein